VGEEEDGAMVDDRDSKRLTKLIKYPDSSHSRNAHQGRIRHKETEGGIDIFDILWDFRH
jgi:hypothetical protein